MTLAGSRWSRHCRRRACHPDSRNPFHRPRICDYVTARESYGKHFTIVVVAEGVTLPPELKENRRTGTVDDRIGTVVAAGARKEVRVSVLGHIQRGVTPRPSIVFSDRFGVAAVELIAQGDFGKMVCLRNESIRQ